MQLAFVLFHYFPYGGLERDMLAMAHVCQQRGHDVTIYTRDWQGEKPADIRIVELPVRALTNHGRAAAFIARFQEAIKTTSASVVIGFNKMPGLDVYYAADTCFAAKAFEQRNFFYRLTPRCRNYMALENAVFGRHSKTHVLMIAKAQIGVYQRYYQTPDMRLHLLPPGIRRECIMPSNYAAHRNQLRKENNLNDNDLLILFVGSDYRRKGLDRALRGIAALSEPLRERVQLWIVGQDNQAPFINLVRTLDLEKNVRFLGARDDVPQLLWAADLLLHPAYSEAAGLVLLEAMVAGLPVIASSVCGYAHYISEHNMGQILKDPITPLDIADAVAAVFSEHRSTWHERSRIVTERADIFSMPERAAQIIERIGAEKNEARS